MPAVRNKDASSFNQSSGNGGSFARAQAEESCLELAVQHPEVERMDLKAGSNPRWHDIPLSMDTQMVERLGGPEAAMHIDTIIGILEAHARFECPDNGAGACVYATAAATYYLEHEAGIGQDTKAHQGTYNGEPHWWASVNGVIVDPTRCQFDDGPAISEDVRYVVEQTFPAGWNSRELVAAEAARSYGLPDHSLEAVGSIFEQIDDCLRLIRETKASFGSY